MRGIIARVGEIPPASGQARNEYLNYHGQKSGMRSVRLFEQCVAELGRGRTEAVPPWLLVPMEPQTDSRLKTEFQALRPVIARLILDQSLGPLPRQQEHALPGERLGRRALTEAVHTYHYLNALDDAHWSTVAHDNLHQIARFVSLVYGCWHEWDEEDGTWFEICPARLAHIPYGQSMGFTSDYVCSICGEDPSQCPHTPEEEHEVVASRFTGSCSICGAQAECKHREGEKYEVHPRPIWSNPVLHEVSLVPKPRDPLTRIMALEIREPHDPPAATQPMWRCWSCAFDCEIWEPR
jgi:hypothetical protein